MRKQLEEVKKTRIPKAIQILVPRKNNNLFHNETNPQLESEATESTKEMNAYTSTPMSSKDSGKPIRFGKLLLPIAEKSPTTSFSITSTFNININFATAVACGLRKPVIVNQPGGSISPFVFSGSYKVPISPTKQKVSNRQKPLRGPSVTRSLSNVHQGSVVEAKKFALRLERHQQMFKSRYAKKNLGNNDIVGMRMNRRFDLLMKFREDQLDADRSAL